MQLLSSILLSFLLVGAEAAVPKNKYNCTSFIVRVPIDNVTLIDPPFPPFADQYAATSFANLVTIRTPSTPKVNLSSLTTTFNISAEYCTPAVQGPNSSTLQILTHGLGFNRSYWDFYLPNATNDAEYSYINRITGAGYSTLSWNRLGIEPSTIADPYKIIQAPVELATLASLTLLARAGNISHVPIPKKVVHVGHSWGSVLSLGLASVAPQLTDGIVLTGFSGLNQYQLLFVASSSFNLASENAPKRFPAKQYSTGYITWPDKAANQYAFLAYPYFDPAVLEVAEATKYPFTIGEFLSLSAIPSTAPNFKGPVLFLASEQDLIFCGSNCTGLYGTDGVTVEAFNGSSSVETYIQPRVGHGLNLHKNATGAYDVVLDWASRNGL
jgi:pimeloyl-ACP methyl ester carboxylesterase